MIVTESQNSHITHHITHSHKLWSQHVTQKSADGHENCGDKMHSHNSNCIYSVANLMGTLSSFLCQSLNKEQLALFWLGV